MSDTVIGGIIAATCVLLGALFSGFGYLFRIRSEKSKIINYNLYYLVRLWHALAIMKYASFEKISSKYIDRYKDKTIDLEVPPNQKQAVIGLCENLLRHEVSTLIDHTINDSGDIFSKSLPELAKINPNLAYDVSKMSYLLSCRKQIYEHVKIVRGKKQENDGNKLVIEYLENFEDGLKISLDKIYIDLIDLIEKSLKGLSLKSNFLIFIKIRYGISARKRNLKSEIPIIELDEMVNKVVAHLEKKKQGKE